MTNQILAAGSLVVGIALIASGITPYDRTTWVLEVAPVLIALPLLWFTRQRFPLTKLLYLLITLHCLVLILGGAYTYARVPLGRWIAELIGAERNPYDKIGHFFQGFVPALIVREVLIRGRYVSGRKMTIFLVSCVVLAISAVYELVEWGTAVVMGEGADAFLGTQGYQWDTQSDMFLALIGSTVALLLLTRLHDRQIHSVGGQH